MSKSFGSWGALQAALEQEVAEATKEVAENSLMELYKNVDRFYSSGESRYRRTGQLQASPQGSFYGGGAVSVGEIQLDTGHTYVPSGRSTPTIYGYAENGGLIGNGGFWSDTVNKIPEYISKSFGSRFN